MDKLLATVQKAFHEAFDVDPKTITLETKPGNIPAWDSMGHLNLVSALERTFNVSFDVDEAMEMENVRQIVKVVDAKLAKGA